MKTKYPRAAAIVAAAILPLAVPTAAQADDALSEPVLMHLKNHPDLSLAWNGESAVLAAEGDQWAFKAVESYDDLGEYLIVHDATGQCLTVADEAEKTAESPEQSEGTTEAAEDAAGAAESSEETEAGAAESEDRSEAAADFWEGAGEAAERSEENGTAEAAEESGTETDAEAQEEAKTTAPVTLADCADALEWSIVLNDNKDDYRFATPDGRYLGIERDSEAAEGSEVLAVAVPSSRHAQEWRFETPVEPEPTPEPSTSAPTTPAAQPKLPQTGVGMTALGGIGLAAVAAGGAMTLWWRRRALRGGQW